MFEPEIDKEDKVYRVFTESYIQCTSNPNFVDKFYDNFMASSEDVRVKFINTDFVKQKKLLLASLSYMILAYTSSDLYHLLGHIAQSHCQAANNISPHLYNYWIDSLCLTAKQCDPDFNETTEMAWRKVMQPGIDYIISGYDQF